MTTEDRHRLQRRWVAEWVQFLIPSCIYGLVAWVFWERVF